MREVLVSNLVCTINFKKQSDMQKQEPLPKIKGYLHIKVTESKLWLLVPAYICSRNLSKTHMQHLYRCPQVCHRAQTLVLLMYQYRINNPSEIFYIGVSFLCQNQYQNPKVKCCACTLLLNQSSISSRSELWEVSVFVRGFFLSHLMPIMNTAHQYTNQFSNFINYMSKH